ncbi:HAD family hydrolase [Leptolyngbya sp. 'hensonii']|uniref:HAD family hydrolase n=1 Tax=Leptolyngbya sp. 'hensonii' TaxID=1922337 RepID=UPI00094F806A|nr:HAD family phosphatase [Leptolyngbya sp. 'hensonii']OLP15605.1 HAD family hydrolase [Leptolyngbya sp. 'hensonii']
MTLKAVLFDFNGVIIKDEAIHQRLIEQLLLEENLRSKPKEYKQLCLGRSDRACLTDILNKRGRCVTDSLVTELIARKTQRYRRELEAMGSLPTYPGLEDLIFNLKAAQIKLAVVSGALRSEVELVLQRMQLIHNFSVIIGGDDITVSKPEPDGYLLAIERLREQFPHLDLQAGDCLAIEDTPAGIQAAKRAGISVVGVANTYPFHMMQRQSNWAVDYLSDLELDRVKQVYARPQ